MHADFDRAVARARIRDAARSDGDNGRAAHATLGGRGYRDVDVPMPPRRRGTPVLATPQRQVRPGYDRDRDTPAASAQPFEDLDLQPLDPVGGPEPAADVSAETPPSQPPATSPPTAAVMPPAATPSPERTAPEGAPRLEPPLMRRIIFLATSRPGETPSYGRAQANLDGQGLRYGIGRFTQASGALGRLLTLFQQRDAEAFDRIFGPDAGFPAAEPAELIRVTTAPDVVPGTPPDQAPRMQPVGGRPVWDPAWIQRFKAAAHHEPFQDMQFRMAAESSLVPMLPFARHLGLATERGLAMLAERAIQLGVAPAREFVIAAAGPINTDALRRAALDHVAADPNRATVADFQAAAGVDEASGQFGPLTHAALVAALRAAGQSPVSLPSPEMMLDRVVQAAARSDLPGLVADIRQNPNLGDVPLADDAPTME